MTQLFDILVIGAGPAGLAAAHAAAAAAPNARIGVVDDNPLAGGQIWRGGAHQQQDGRAIALLNELQAAPNITFMQHHRVLYAPADGQLLVQSPDAAAVLHYQRLILATGARELLLPFPGWTLPGVTGAGGLQALAKGGFPVAGKRVVVAGSGPLLLAVAATLTERGAQVVAIAEQAAKPQLARFALGLLATPSKIAQALKLWRSLRGIPYHRDSYVTAAKASNSAANGAAGSASGQAGQPPAQLHSVELQSGGRTQIIACDYLACGYGLVPNPELAMALGCAIIPDTQAVRTDTWQLTTVPGIYCAGEGTGVGGVDKALAEGRIAGLAAAGRQDLALPFISTRSRWQAFARRLARAFALRPEIRALADDSTIVCRCEDVCHGELRQHDSWRSAKLHTRCGMGPCQGRICGSATATLYGWRPDSVRVPITPARVDSIIIQP
ncbi:FAD/NAD(P)-binding oxidoreductase [Massilia sp. Root351]|jgi:NADPH-dependent 2,4-dienoyl-CoA reductase/sulfur reductase-like enzyme|uniref:NAD(P)/FAD-dependent oxidoreductase n=1 Tax=Massilia sp. Root351 TaxID=1736522 RepID=UPI000710F8BB|nr:FAD/NAD(P)-binding oxidoreductase [Massilia sp. Root351]KQV84658.1 FAD/NAD(P)-binding oxidoreductase [Massilia sp. Root351]